MIYKIRLCTIRNDGTTAEGKRTECITWPTQLRVGGIYALRPGKFYRVVGEEV